jgi:phage terminase large subunit
MMSPSASVLKSWREYPAQFVYDNFKAEPDAWQQEALNAIGGEYKPVRRVGTKACTGPGKTAVLAWGGWHRLSCYGKKHKHPKGAALSITRDNLKDNLWPELAIWQQRSEYLKTAFTATKERIYANDHPDSWFLSARSFAKDADKAAIGRALSGLHSPFPFVLLDETGDMPAPVGQAAEQIFTGSPEDALIMAAGNPTSTTGLLYQICTKLRSQWVIITITADPDDPKRTPRVNIDLARDQIKEYGKENPWVMATILGLFPPVGFNSLIGIEDIEESMKRHYRPEDYAHAAKILGVDVAREGDDRSTLCPRQGLVAFRPKIFRNVRSNVLAGYVAQAEDKWDADGTIIDGTGGYGSGVIDAGFTMGRTWLDCQFAGKAFSPKFANKRAEILFAFADWIVKGGALPYLPELVREMTAITYTFQGDQFLVVPKKILKQTLGISPDLTDGYATTFAFPIAQKQRIPANIHVGAGGEYDPVARAISLMQQTSGRGEYNPFAPGGRS